MLTKPNRDAIRAALTSGLWAFIGTFGATLLDWLQDVAAWATDHEGIVAFPDTSVLTKAAVAAVVAFFTIVVAATVRLAQANGLLAGKPPTYPTTP